MKTRLALVVLLLIASNSYGMGAIRAALSNLPPVVVTNAPPAPPVPVPEPVPPVVTSTPPIAVDGPRIVSIKHGGNWDVFIRTAGCEGWPTKRDPKKNKTTMGELMIRPVGMKKAVFVDSMRVDQFSGAKKELNNAFGAPGAEHALDVHTGEDCEVYIRSYHGKKTEVWMWKWPFGPT